MDKYTPTIGLEIHAELKTRTKMFCNSLNDPDEKEPNSNICPICMGHPGTLPVINKEAVKHVLKVGLALGSKIADYTEFDRKNYFYPDIPKGYQISQYKYPLVKGGELNGVKITRIHLEEDTARSLHSSAVELKAAKKTEGDDSDASLVDFNRAGIPLMELVTEPVIHSAAQAGNFARELQLLLRTLGVAEANMEKGEMRVEANVSISKDGELGTKTEVKNINSFRAAEKAIEYEIKRQTSLLEEGKDVVQETRGWDDAKGETFSQREKEESHDYRYFPDPDLPKLKISDIEEFSIENLGKEIPELPWEKRIRYKEEFGIKEEDIEVFVSDKFLADFFEKSVAETKDKDLVQKTSNYITSDLMGLMKTDPAIYLGSPLPYQLKITPENFKELIEMVAESKLSSRGAKDILSIMYKEGGNPKNIAEERNLLQTSNESELIDIAQRIVKNNPTVVEEYKAGKESVIKFFIGEGMKETRGSANPQALADIFKKLLS